MALPTCKNLILWRHAEAENVLTAGQDINRRLTQKGESQAATMASWLKSHLRSETTIICSPAVRAKQTAQALKLPYEINPHLLPKASSNEVLQFVHALIQTDHRHNLLLVGHQPWLGQLAAYFLQGSLLDLSIKKSAVWWFKQDLTLTGTLESASEPQRYKLVAVQSPRFVID